MTPAPDSSATPFTQSQIEWLAERDAVLDRNRERWVDRRLKRATNRAIVGFLILTAGFGLSFSKTADTGTLHEGLTNSCERVNVLRAQSNLSDSVSFNILSLSAERERKLARQATNTKARATHYNSAVALEEQARKLRVTKSTDCDLAVNHPDHYQFPLAGPLGDPRTGRVNPGVKAILRDSAEIARDNTDQGLGGPGPGTGPGGR